MFTDRPGAGGEAGNTFPALSSEQREVKAQGDGWLWGDRHRPAFSICNLEGAFPFHAQESDKFGKCQGRQPKLERQGRVSCAPGGMGE